MGYQLYIVAFLMCLMIVLGPIPLETFANASCRPPIIMNVSNNVAYSVLSFKDKISTVIHIFLDKSVVSKQYNDSCLVFFLNNKYRYPFFYQNQIFKNRQSLLIRYFNFNHCSLKCMH